MHLCLTTDGAAAMSTDTRVRLENGGRGEPDCGDFPRSALADREDVELLRCQDATDISAPFKFRRYGYASLYSGSSYTLEEVTCCLKPR